MRILALSLLCACSDYSLEKKDKAADAGTHAGEPDHIVEIWDLGADHGADLLFFGDTSGSMAEELTVLGDQVSVFLSRLAAYTSRWQLLAVTGPDGCGVNGVITPETQEWEASFAQGILTPPGEDLVDEWGLNNVAAAVELTDEGECNAGFLRDDSRLHVIFLSDEDDNSPGWDGGDPTYWEPYVDTVLARKSEAGQVVFSGVIGPVPDGCEGAEPGVGYADAIEATGGAVLSICEAWEEELDALVDATVQVSIYRLSTVPDLATLEVTVDEVVRTAGWTWDSDDNAVIFVDDPPILGQVVEITYLPVE